MHFLSATLTLLRRCSLSYRNQFLCDVWINATFIFILTLSAPTPQNMVKHTQTIRRHEPTNCFSMFDYFVG